MPWTKEHIEEIRAIAPFVNVTGQQCDEQLDLIRNSPDPVPVIRREERGRKENFRVEDSGALCGVITLSLAPDTRTETWEIDVLVYRKYRRGGIAREAISQVIAAHPSRAWQAMIVLANPLQQEIGSMLRELGFDLREGVYLLPATSQPEKKKEHPHSPMEELTPGEEPREKPE